MRAPWFVPFVPLLALCCVPLPCPAQQNANQPAQTNTQAHTNPLGFSYSLPADWQVVDAAPSLPAAKQQATQNATSEDEKKGVACTQVTLTARHGSPASVIVVVDLPFACYGEVITAKDIPGFGAGAAEGLKQSFQISDPIYGGYTLGTHTFWIERAKGTPKSNPNSQYTIEIACTALQKGAACWMTMAADADGLRVFEDAVVALEGEPATALVPANAFTKSPS